VQCLVVASVLSVTSVPVAVMPSDWRYGATVVSNRAMLSSSSTQLSAADISVRENSKVTNGPGGGVEALRAVATPACGAVATPACGAVATPACGACAGPRATAPVVGTSATAAATVTALSRPARLLPGCLLSRSPVIMATS
jgi:hypothetical protein